MGVRTNKSEVTHHSSLNCFRVTFLQFHTDAENQDNKEHAYKMARLLLFLFFFFFVAFMGFTVQAVLFGKVG